MVKLLSCSDHLYVTSTAKNMNTESFVYDGDMGSIPNMIVKKVVPTFFAFLTCALAIIYGIIYRSLANKLKAR